MKRVIAMAALACVSAGCSQTTETTTQEKSTTQTVGAPVPSVETAGTPEVTKREPSNHLIRIGVTYLVDNGKCPAGQVQRVIKPKINIGKLYKCVDDPRS